ncbi:MAG TPA: TetR/AcrR family transcriptional regulator [Syntrophales bacterium]|nr:TetR/AcrR family transcriptional regulator [Syntrophales bacterium]
MKESGKRTQIIRTATDLFSRFGTKRVTVEEICRTAWVSKVTFYKYFTNKTDLIRNIRDELIETGFARFDEISAMDIPFPEKIALMTRWRIEFFARMKDEFIHELYTLDDVVEEAKRRYMKNIADAQEKGEIRSDLSPELIWLVTERLNGIVRDESWKTIFSDYGEFQEQMRTFFFFGLLARSDVKTKAGGET